LTNGATLCHMRHTKKGYCERKIMIAQVKNPGLRQATVRKFERQTAFGWIIALAIFLGGAGGGIFLIGYFTKILYGSYLSKIGLTIGPLIAIACTICLFIDLGKKMGMQQLFLNVSRLSSSWISRGAWALSSFVVFGLAYALTLWNAFSGPPWEDAAGFLGIVAALSAMMVLLYTGFLLGVIKSIPFWNNPLLPVLFITSGLSCGAAVLLIIAPFVPVDQSPVLATITQAEVIFILTQLLMLWAYLGVASHRDLASAESIRLIKTPITLIIALGLLLPLGLLVISLASGMPGATTSFDFAAAIMELIGAFFLRFSILNAGVTRRLSIR